NLVDEDTNAFNKIIDGFRMPKETDEEKQLRAEAIENATKYAAEVPFKVMKTAYESMEVMQEMMRSGLASSLSDGAVGIMCAKAAVAGAFFNVKINAKDIKDRTFAENLIKKGEEIFDKTLAIEAETIKIINEKLA